MDKRIIISILLLLGAIVFVGLLVNIFDTSKQTETPLNACSVDSECAAASCCHPDSCVPVSQAPDCKSTMCTMDCKPGTMDCGQGKCSCADKQCKAVLS